jgi:hypothetical protein
MIIYFSWCISLQCLKSVKQKVLKILSSQYTCTHMSSLTPWPQNQLWSSTFHDVLVYKVWSLSGKGFSRYWVVSIFLCPTWPLDLWTSKSIMVIYFSWCTSLHSLKSVKQRVLKIMNSQYIICPIWHLDLWPFNLKINRGHLLFRNYQCVKFEVRQAKGSQDNERIKYSYFQF